MLNRADIEEMLATYSTSFDAGDAAQAASVFTDDALMKLSIGRQGVVAEWNGRAEIQGMLQGGIDGQEDGEQRRHHVTGLRVQQTSSGATASSVILVTRALGDSVGFLTSGSQADVIIQTSDGLRLASRDLHVDVPF